MKSKEARPMDGCKFTMNLLEIILGEDSLIFGVSRGALWRWLTLFLVLESLEFDIYLKELSFMVFGCFTCSHMRR